MTKTNLEGLFSQITTQLRNYDQQLAQSEREVLTEIGKEALTMELGAPSDLARLNENLAALMGARKEVAEVLKQVAEVVRDTPGQRRVVAEALDDVVLF